MVGFPRKGEKSASDAFGQAPSKDPQDAFGVNKAPHKQWIPGKALPAVLLASTVAFAAGLGYKAESVSDSTASNEPAPLSAECKVSLSAQRAKIARSIVRDKPLKATVLMPLDESGAEISSPRVNTVVRTDWSTINYGISNALEIANPIVLTCKDGEGDDYAAQYAGVGYYQDGVSNADVITEDRNGFGFGVIYMDARPGRVDTGIMDAYENANPASVGAKEVVLRLEMDKGDLLKPTSLDDNPGLIGDDGRAYGTSL